MYDVSVFKRVKFYFYDWTLNWIVYFHSIEILRKILEREFYFKAAKSNANQQAITKCEHIKYML